jgi:hypothetical protein
MLTFGVHHPMTPSCSAEGGRLESAKFLSRKKLTWERNREMTRYKFVSIAAELGGMGQYIPL